MKKTFKRLGAVLLAAFMLLSTTICALADDTADTSTTGKKITLNVSNVADGDTVSAYRLVEYNNDGNGYTFFKGENTKKGFEQYIKSQDNIGEQTAEQYLAGLDATGVNKLLEGYAAKCNEKNSEYTLPSNPITSKSATKNTAALEGLEPGYYLLLTSTDTKNNRIYTPLSAFIQKDGNDLVVYAGANNSPLKAESDKSYKVAVKAENGPTIDKKTNATKGDGEATWKETAAAGVNDIVRFYVEVNIPKYNNVSALNLTVNDTLTNLKYQEGSVKVYENRPDPKGHNDSNNEIQGAIKNSANVVEQDYTTSNGAGTQKLKFELDYQKIMGENAAQSKTVYIYYEAIMQKEAVTGTKVNVIIGKAYGTAYVAMNSKSIGADLVYAWDNAEIGMMDASLAAKIMYADADAAELNEKAAQYRELQNGVASAAARGYVDTVISPADTRKYVIGAFEMLFTKREDRPSKKHGTV